MEGRNNTTIPTSNSTPLRSINAPSFNLELVIILVALIPLTVAGNSLVCFAFLKYQKIRTATNCFLFSLAISDLAVGLILIPLWIAYIATGGFQDLPRSFRDGWSILDITCSVASMANLAGVSIERWYGVCYPFRHRSMSINYAVLTSIASWVYALGVASLILLYDPYYPWAITAITCLGLFLPFIIMIISYCAIARQIKQKSLINSQRSGKDCKTIRTLIILSVIFTICWLPFAIESLLINYCDPCALYVLKKPRLHIFPKVLHYANSCINPILYSLFSPSFKTAFRDMFCVSRRTRRRIQRRSMLSTERSGSGSSTKKTTGSIVISFKEKRKSNGVRRDSMVVEKLVI